MDIKVEHLENHIARITVDVEVDRLESAKKEAARHIAQRAQIPGFRRGKAPYNVILRYFGEAAILEEAIDHLGQKVYQEALEETKIEPYGPASLENVLTEPTLSLTFSLPKRPEVNLGNYRETRLPFEIKLVEDELVDKAFTTMQEERALLEPADRPARLGDLVSVELTAVIEPETAENESPADQAESEGAPVAQAEEPFIDEEMDIILDETDDLAPDFSAQLVGLKAGNEKEFELTFPADHPDDMLAGKRAAYSVMLHEVKSRTLPALNDDFANQVSDGQAPSLLELRMKVRENLQTRLTRDAEASYAIDALDKIVEQAEFHYPAIMVEEYIDGMLDSLDQNLRRQGLTLQDYLKIESTDQAALRAGYREAAEKRLRRALAMGELARQEQLQVDDQAEDREIEMISQHFSHVTGRFRQVLMRGENRRSIAVDMFTNQVLRRLAEIARGDNPPLGPSPTPAEAASQTELSGIILQDQVVAPLLAEAQPDAAPSSSTGTPTPA